MTCTKCGEKAKDDSKHFAKTVVEINNPEKRVLMRKVVVPASMGTEEEYPASVGKFFNVLLAYEANGHIYLYSSDGIPTMLSTDVGDLADKLENLRIVVTDEITAREEGDAALSSSIEALSSSLSSETTARELADQTLQDNIDALDDSLATVAKTGSYTDLSDKPTIGNGTITFTENNVVKGTFSANATEDKTIEFPVPTQTSQLTNNGSDGTSTYVETKDLPTIGNATLTITENSIPKGTFTANATSNTNIDLVMPTKTSDLTNDGSDGTSTYVETDELPTIDTAYDSTSNNAIANSTVTSSLDRDVMTNLALDTNPSTTTINLSNTKTNLATPSSTTTSSISLPVASSTQAGVMNAAMYDALTKNTQDIANIIGEVVAITGLPVIPTQAQLTTAWLNASGESALINGAGIYDVTNEKRWTYYSNDTTWYALDASGSVTVNPWSNAAAGIVKGSTNVGQIFAENDGTGSVNGWDTLTDTVEDHTSKLATIEQGAEVNVQADWAETVTTADDYIKNKPQNLVQDANYVHTDNNFTNTLKTKLDGIATGAEVNVQSDWDETNTSSDAYILHKPANLVQDASYVHTDNNFTTTLKNKLNGIATGAEVNVQSDWDVTDTTSDAYILHKPQNLVQDASYVHTDNNFTTALKNKLNGITVNNATLTVQNDGTNVGTFTANSATNETVNIVPPVKIGSVVSQPSSVAYVGTNNITNGAVTTNKVAAGAITTAKVANNAITAAKTNFGGNYSTSEVDTGFTWIDGKHIYKKTVNFGTLPNSSTKTVAHGITNLNWIIGLEGVAKSSSGDRLLMPFPWEGSGGTIACYADSNNIIITTWMDRSDYSGYVTLHYTKSS